VTNLTEPIACSGNCKTPPIKQMVFHSGGISGVTTLLVIFPEQDYVISVLSNLGENLKILDMVWKIATNFA